MSSLPGRASSAIPERIGKYEIRQELGRGGFGQVFLGFDPTVGRQVAIKVLASDGDPNSLRRFRHEASAAGNLNHKNIVTIYEFGEYQGTFFIAMEYLEGSDLQHVVSSHRDLSLLDKVRIMSGAAEGLQCAHQNGIIHRDVKPANIMVLDDGSVKLMDFGIARLTRDHTTRLTETGFLIGSVFYMAPEQLNAQEIDGRCDIWAFGTIFYELLCGRHPFEAPDVASAIMRIMQHEPKDIQVVCPECPDTLAAVLNRLLSKDRDARYQSFEDVLFDTAPILRDLQFRQAEEYASQAGDLVRSGKLEEAQTLVKKIFAYNPAHELGRAVWQQLQSEFRNRSLRLRAQALIDQSDKSAAARDFGAAIQALESALRLDPGDAILTARLAELRAAKQRFELASRLVSSARESLQLDNLSAAFRLLGDALRAEPDNSEAQRLLNDVQNRISERDLQKRVRDGLAKARGLVALQSFDEAVGILEDLSGQVPAAGEVRAALELARQQRQEYERKRFIQSELDAAKREIKSSQFDSAIARLERLANEFPGQGDVATLLTYARSELEASQHLGKIKAAAGAAWKLLKAREFDKALTEADAALLTFPDDPGLLRLRQTIITERAEQERVQFIRQSLAESAEMERAGRVEQACAILKKALQRYNSEPSLADALARMQIEVKNRAEQERARFIQQALAESAEQERAGSVEQACATLEKALQRYGSESSLVDVLARMRQKLVQRQKQERAEQERAQLVQRVLGESAESERNGRLEEACGILEEAVQRYNSEPSLSNALARTRQKLDQQKKRAEREHAEFILNVLAESADLERQGLLEQACATLEKALQRYNSEPSLANHLVRIRQRLVQGHEQERAAALERDLRDADTFILQGQTLRASQLLTQLKATFPGESRVSSLLDRARSEERRRAELDALCAEAQRFLDAHQPDQACEFLERRKEFEAEPRVAALEAAAKKMRARKGALDRARAALQERNWRVAANALEAILQQEPNDPESRRVLEQARDLERIELRRNRIDAGRMEAEKLIRGLQFQEAARRLRALCDEFPDEQSIRDDLTRALEGIEHQSRREAYTQGRNRAAAFLKTGQYQAAIGTLEEMAGQFPDDPILKEELHAAREARDEHARHERYASGRRQAGELAQARKLEDAISAIEALLAEFPGDSVLQEDLKSALGAKELQEQRERLDREVAMLEKLYRKGDARGVKERASALPPDLQDARVRGLLDWAATELERSQQDSAREPAESLRHKRNRRNLIIAAIVIGGVLVGGLIAYTLRPVPLAETLTTNPEKLTFSLKPGFPAVPQTIRVRGHGTDGRDGVPWSATVSVDWLSVKPKRGVTQGQTTVSVDPNLLNPESHSGYILMTSEDGTAHARISVNVVMPASGSPGVKPPAPAQQVQSKPPEQAPPAIHKPPAVPAASPSRGETRVNTAAVSQESHLPPTPDSTGEKQAVISRPALTPASDCGPGYHRRKRGDITWTSNVGIEAGGSVVIGGLNPNLAGGHVDTNSLPGCPVEVESKTKGVDVVEQPSQGDGFRSVTVRNSSGGPVPQIDLTWKIK